MGECLRGCKDADCMRDCIANVEGFLGPRAVAQHPLEDCLDEGFHNIRSCATVVLLRADDIKFDVDSVYWTCVQVASRVFDQCRSDDPGLSLELETTLRRIYIGYLVDTAEGNYKLFLAGELATKYPELDISTDGGDATPPGGQRQEGSTFDECLAVLVQNIASCDTGCGAHSGCLTICYKGAEGKFNECLGLPKPAPK